IPFIENQFGLKLDHSHIDLRYVLVGLGFSGGLKGCERQLGINRGDLSGVDWYFAVLLWNDYIRNNNKRALETLLAYNIEDVVNLEKLMVISYNMK
ncbi:MAG: ribonuclease H-like domain-containing protein, partial [Deltaproteobacteria bacterium]|nr:ribonuclease H-like domain-containing protein [Deltaproteobacteria bacterium]